MEPSIPEFVSLGHTLAVTAVAAGDTASQVFSASWDGTIRLWDIQSGRCTSVIPARRHDLLSLAYCRTSQTVVTKGQNGQIHCWNPEAGCIARTIETSGTVISHAILEGIRGLLTTDGASIHIWDLETGLAIGTLLPKEHVTHLAASSGLSYFLAGTLSGNVIFYDIESLESIDVFDGHGVAVTSVAICPDSNNVAVCHLDGMIRCWHLSSRKPYAGRSFGAHVNCMTFSTSETLVLAADGSESLDVWTPGDDSSKRISGHFGQITDVAYLLGSENVATSHTDKTVRIWNTISGRCIRTFSGHPGSVTAMCVSRDFKWALSGSDTRNIRLWNLESGECKAIFRGHRGAITALTFSPDISIIASGSEDCNVKLWNMNGDCLGTYCEHLDEVTCLAFSPDGNIVYSGSDDRRIVAWNRKEGRRLFTIAGHTGSITHLAVSEDGTAIACASGHNGFLFDAKSGHELRRFFGHNDHVTCVSVSVDKKLFVSGSTDRTVRSWSLESADSARVIEGHSDGLSQVSLGSKDVPYSISERGRIVRWDIDSQEIASLDSGVLSVIHGVVHLNEAILGSALGYFKRISLDSMTVAENGQYTNAKVLFVGDSGAGKTGLSHRLALGSFLPSAASTIGVWATHLPLPGYSSESGVSREIWLWDFAGQSDQRLIQQLFTDRCGAILLLFNADQDDPIPGLREWNDALERSAAHAPLRILVAARTDTGFRAPKNRLKEFAEHHGMKYIETSALSGLGCDVLIETLKTEIPWDKIETRSSPPIFKSIRDEIVKLRDEGEVLLTIDRLQYLLERRLGEDAEVEKNLKAVVGLLDGPGVVKELDFGNYVLLRPEWISRYAQAVIRTLRADDLQLGSMEADRIRNGELVFSVTYEDKVREEERLPEEQEKVVLRAMEEALVAKCLCLRMDDKLVFPSHCGRERPSLPTYPNVSVSYRFGGYLDDVYATLVTRIFYSRAFKLTQIWRDAADFETLDGEHCIGVRLNREDDGSGTIQLYRDKEVKPEVEVIFANFIHEHLKRTGKDVARQRHYVCPNCGEPYLNLEVVRERLAENGKDAKVMCARCEERFPLWDRLEQLFPDPEVHKQILRMEEATRINVDMRRQAEILVGEVHAIVAEANQKFNEIPGNNDEGIDVELEFTDAENVTTGVKAHLQLKCGNSHLKMRSDESERFVIDNLNWLTVWSRQPGPVFLVIGTLPDERDRDRRRFREIRFMEFTKEALAELQSRLKPGQKSISIDFDGEPFTKHTVLEWRRKYAKDFL